MRFNFSELFKVCDGKQIQHLIYKQAPLRQQECLVAVGHWDTSLMSCREQYRGGRDETAG